MLNHQRSELAERTTSNPTIVSRSVWAWTLAVSAAAGLGLFAAGPASADLKQVTRSTPVVITGDLRDPRVDVLRRDCGNSPHGTRRTIVDPFSGRESVLQCIDGTWVTVG